DTLGGASAGNYTLTEPVGLVANITPATLTVAGQSAGTKVYDGTLSAVLTGGSLSGVIAGDAPTLTLTEAGRFLAKNVGTGLGVTASDTLGGASAGNYTLTEPVGLVANITPATLTVAGQSAGTKVYDGTLSAVLTGGSLSGVIAGDAPTLTLTEAGRFLAKNVGTGLGVTASDTLGGASAGNYTLTEPVGLVANITPATLTVAGQSAGTKVYDGTLSAVLTGGSLSGVIAGDAPTLTLTEAGRFLAKNVGTGLGVTASDTLGGASAGNYTLTEPVGLVANITPATLTVAGQSAGTKVYDGTLSAVLTGGSLSGVIAGDAPTLTLTEAGRFLAKNVGTGLGVTASDTLGGASAGNYTLTEPVGLVANITPATLTVAGQSAGTKVYDGTLSAVLTGGSLSGVIAGDAPTLTLTEAGRFLAKNVGTGLGVTASDTLGGASAGNYPLTEPVGLVANITPATLTVAGQSAGTKVYDGTLSAVLTGGSLSGVIAGDAGTLTLTQAGSFLAKNV